ncbi:MAG: putative peptidoglycan glycosyltransferase FtsW [Patescibacteria group bacterium]
MSQKRKIDKVFASIAIALVLLGFFLFVSASLGVLAKDKSNFLSVFSTQIILGLAGGMASLIILSKIYYREYRKYAFYIFVVALIISCLVFIPNIGIEHGGAKRWLDIAGVSFQPAEFLKIGFVIYFATLLSAFKLKLHQWKYGIIPIMSLLFSVAVIAFFQPDYGTLLVIAITALGMILVAGINLKHFFVIIGSALITIVPLTLIYKSYILSRLLFFFKPGDSLLGAGYQIKQSLIAIGSGGIFGKGFGQSIQKFGLLPEPMGDSIFAVTAEEWGFIGATILTALFLFFALRGLSIASRSQDVFGRLLAVGIVILIVSQSFLNIASMLSIFPIIGMPLIFVSQGGTALLFALAEVGILLNISKYKTIQ